MRVGTAPVSARGPGRRGEQGGVLSPWADACGSSEAARPPRTVQFPGSRQRQLPLQWLRPWPRAPDPPPGDGEGRPWQPLQVSEHQAHPGPPASRGSRQRAPCFSDERESLIGPCRPPARVPALCGLSPEDSRSPSSDTSHGSPVWRVQNSPRFGSRRRRWPHCRRSLCPRGALALGPLPPGHAAARAAHRAGAVGARRGAAVVRAVRAGLGAAGGHARPVAGPAQPGAAPAALPVAGRPAVRRLLLLRGAAGLPGALVGLRAAGRALHLRQHQFLLLDRGHRALPVPQHRPHPARAPRRPPAPGLPRRQLGGPPGHHRGRRRPEEDRLRRLGRVRGLVLDRPGGGGPGPVDAADREAVGAAGLRHAARALPPHPEAHQQGAPGAVRVPAHPVRGAPAAAPQLHGGQEAGAHPTHLHLPPRLEHRALRADPVWLPGRAGPGARRSARDREHVSGRCQLHHVRALHPRRPHPALRPLLLPAPAARREPGRAQGLCGLQDGGLGDPGGPLRTSAHLSPLPGLCGRSSWGPGSDPLQGGRGTLQQSLPSAVRAPEACGGGFFYLWALPEAAGARTVSLCSASVRGRWR